MIDFVVRFVTSPLAFWILMAITILIWLFASKK